MSSRDALESTSERGTVSAGISWAVNGMVAGIRQTNNHQRLRSIWNTPINSDLIQFEPIINERTLLT
jgi:hypothetical protein